MTDRIGNGLLAVAIFCFAICLIAVIGGIVQMSEVPTNVIDEMCHP